MLVVGPTGRQVRLPCAKGLTYPGHGTAVTRTVFDAMLHEAAVAAGATPIFGRADEPLEVDGRFDGFRLSTGDELRADFVIGADGATSRVASAAGLVDPNKVLWGFAIRTYVAQTIDLPAIILWEPTPWRAFPGYGWVFPGAEGGANVGLGLGTLSDRKAGANALRALPEFLEHVRALGLLADTPASTPSRRLGGWLKMGIVGTIPASGRVLLVGDAAGLVNPLQGEGISQAMGSGRSAADAVLGGPRHVAERYRATLAAEHLPYHRITAATQAALVGRPRATAAVARMLTAVGGGKAMAGGWAIFWNELLDGAPLSRHRSIATAVTHMSRSITARTATARWFDDVLPEQTYRYSGGDPVHELRETNPSQGQIALKDPGR
jgi:flavin-dependent dehydrogenase